MKTTPTTIDLTQIFGNVARAVRERSGFVPDVASKRTQHLESRIKHAKAVPSVCPYCAVGCATLAYVRDDGTLLDVEGNPDSPVNGGHLCPKGSAIFGLTVNSERWTTAKYRAPYSDKWEDRPLDWAMERIAQLVKKTREETFVKEKDGKRVNHTLGI